VGRCVLFCFLLSQGDLSSMAFISSVFFFLMGNKIIVLLGFTAPIYMWHLFASFTFGTKNMYAHISSIKSSTFLFIVVAAVKEARIWRLNEQKKFQILFFVFFFIFCKRWTEPVCIFSKVNSHDFYGESEFRVVTNLLREKKKRERKMNEEVFSWTNKRL